MFNKKMMLLTQVFLFASLLLVAPLTAADDNCQKACDKAKVMDKACMMKDLLKLSPEQMTKMEAMHADMNKMMTEQRTEMQKQHQAMKELIKKGDMKLIEAKIDEIAKLQAAMMKKKLAHRMAVRALLNDEQKVKFDEMDCCMMAAGHGAACAAKAGCGEKCDKDGKKGHCDKASKDHKCEHEGKAVKPQAAKSGAGCAVACGDDCSRCEKAKK